MLWFLFAIGFIIIFWPLILRILAPVGKFILMIIFIPMIWILKLFRRPATQAEEDKLYEDTAKLATALLCLTIMGLVIWWGIRTT